jgi:tetratricopeptide (TPR) repeat protein
LKAIELKPDDVLAYYNLGNTYDDQGQYEEAVEVYQRVIELNPDNFNTYNNLGVAYNHLEQFNKAASCFQQAIILDSLNNFNYYTALGYAYFGMDSNKLALSAFERAVELAPDNPWNYYNICRLYAFQEDIPNAMIWLEISLMKGFHDWVQIDFDTYLDSIRNREEFKKLIDFYEKKNGTPN